MNFYNEIDKAAADWLEELIRQGEIPPGVVDRRDIRDIRPNELHGFTQCHFFAGIGGWPLALRLAGWPDDRRVWTGSCPCQPFSAAGRGDGFTDERHLWPHWHHLIANCSPDIAFGEQVASKDGLAWLDLVYADLEGTGYAVWATDLCAAGVGSPQRRQRLWIGAERLGHGLGAGLEGFAGDGDGAGRRTIPAGSASEAGEFGGLGDTDLGISEQLARQGSGPDEASGGRAFGQPSGHGDFDGLEDRGRPGPVNGFWGDSDWLFCRDGKWRPVEPGTSPLADGLSARVGRLRGYGNAINPIVGKVFIQAFCEARGIPLYTTSMGAFDLECH